MQKESHCETKISSQLALQSIKPGYASPKILELGKVEKLTHGSREKTSDEPDSGHKGD